MARPFMLPNRVWVDADSVIAVDVVERQSGPACVVRFKPDGASGVFVDAQGEATAASLRDVIGVAWHKSMSFDVDPDLLSDAFRQGWDACWEETEGGETEEEAERLLDEALETFLEHYRT